MRAHTHTQHIRLNIQHDTSFDRIFFHEPENNLFVSMVCGENTPPTPPRRWRTKRKNKKTIFFLQFFSVSCCFYLAIKLEDTFPSWTTVENVVRKKKKKGVRRDYKIAFNLYEPQKRGAKMWNFHSESIQGNWLKTLIKIRPNNGDEIVKIEVMRILDAIWRWINVIEGFLYHVFFFLLFRWKPQSF